VDVKCEMILWNLHIHQKNINTDTVIHRCELSTNVIDEAILCLGGTEAYCAR
jgi:hypothetical protein